MVGHGTHHFGWDPQFIELLLVVRSRLGAVIRNKHELFA